MLGYGYPRESLEKGLAAGPAFIGVDNGSTDPGAVLSGKRHVVLETAFVEAGSGAGAGCGVGTSNSADYRKCRRIRRSPARGVVPIDSEGDRGGTRPAFPRGDDSSGFGSTDRGRPALAEGRMSPCGPAPELTAEAIRGCPHLVGQMGTGPIEKAIESEADVIVVGRCCDTAVFAALPMMRGFDGGLAMHCAKIARMRHALRYPGRGERRIDLHASSRPFRSDAGERDEGMYAPDGRGPFPLRAAGSELLL